MSYRDNTLQGRLTRVVGLAPNKCLLCGKDVFEESLGYCDNCKQYYTVNNGATCVTCGAPLIGTEDYCTNCSDEVPHFDKAYSTFIYNGGIVNNIYSMKFGNNGAIAQVFAKQLAALACMHNIEFDVVTFVPMHENKLKVRGYNQSQLLAEYFCDFLDRQCFSYDLVKVRDTSPQEGLSRTERKDNLKGAFRVTTKGAFKQKHVLLIDDVKTTNSTLSECAKILTNDGASSVVCLTIASNITKPRYEV